MGAEDSLGHGTRVKHLERERREEYPPEELPVVV